MDNGGYFVSAEDERSPFNVPRRVGTDYKVAPHDPNEDGNDLGVEEVYGLCTSPEVFGEAVLALT